MKFLFGLLCLCTTFGIFAQTKWSHESELSLVTISGNSESKTTSAKQTTKYAQETNSITTTASYTKSQARNSTTDEIETSARSGHVAVRNDHVFYKQLSGFIGHGFYTNRFAGFIQEDRSDLGLTYQFVKSDTQELSMELGYQHSEFNYVTGKDTGLNSLRLASVYSNRLNNSVSTNLKIEYRNAFREGKEGHNGNSDELYWVDYEASMVVVMTGLFSLKVGYESKYQNFRPAGTERREDTKFTTALVAKF